MGPLWRDVPFAWRRWDRFQEDWTRDHCEFCFACICNQRDRFPDANFDERGCYRQAYYAEQLNQKEHKIYIWVCRTCFKRVKTEFGWLTVS